MAYRPSDKSEHFKKPAEKHLPTMSKSKQSKKKMGPAKDLMHKKSPFGR